MKIRTIFGVIFGLIVDGLTFEIAFNLIKSGSHGMSWQAWVALVAYLILFPTLFGLLGYHCDK